MLFSTHVAEQAGQVTHYRQGAGVAILRERFSEAQQQAQAWDTLIAAGAAPALAGLTVAVKACFDVQGWPTTAGSQVLAEAPAAVADAPIVAALRRAGAVVTTQTNMTEFAFGALGLNPHFGTPLTPLDPHGERIAGGSTSGGAVAVALGLADLALGSDTSGSVRIPAAFCGVVGFKPTHGRYRDEGMFFLSPTFDVPGFIARDVRTLLRVDGELTPEPLASAGPASLRGRRFLVPTPFALDAADAQVAQAFATALEALRGQGADIVEASWPELPRYGEVAVEGGIIVAEAYNLHRVLLRAAAERYDPRVGPRIALGEQVAANRYLQALDTLRGFKADYHRRLLGYDALLTPCVPFVPPTLAELADETTYYRINRQAFRLTEVANRIDAPSISLPLSPAQPMGLCLTGRHGDDRALLHLAHAVEAALHPSLA